MFRVLKALPFTLALASLSFFAMSCGSASKAQVRILNAIPDSSQSGLDVDVNGTKVTTAPLIFPGFQPATGYFSVASGSDSFQAFLTGTTTIVTQPISVSLSSTTYTEIATGFVNGSGVNGPTFVSITDNNTAPTAGNVEFRVINASPSSPGGLVDVYIVPPGTDILGLAPTISGLSFTQGSTYQSLVFATNGYQMIVTPSGTQNGLVNQIYATPTGSIRTIVLVDQQGGGQMSQFPQELNDLD
jgi:Domain of unknown function (DUF4397)